MSRGEEKADINGEKGGKPEKNVRGETKKGNKVGVERTFKKKD